MTVGNRTFSGKGARDEAAKALNEVILSWANDQTMHVRAKFRGFEIVSRGHALGSDNDPEVYVKGALTYRAQLNPENPLGTIQSIEHVLRNLDRRQQQEREEIEQPGEGTHRIPPAARPHLRARATPEGVADKTVPA